MTAVETERFLRDTASLTPTAVSAELVLCLAANPEAGDLMLDTGGVRKHAGHCRAEASAAARG